MLILQGVTCAHPGKDPLFTDLHLTVNRHAKIALVGNNGTGKSTLLRIMSGELQPAKGTVSAVSKPYYLPQLWDRFEESTIAGALQVADRLHALQDILRGDVTERNMEILGDDWIIEERCREALAYWQLEGLDWNQPVRTLSGGQKTKLFLAGIRIHEPEMVLLDEPGNHLDGAGRELLQEFISATTAALVLVSHDRELLNLSDQVWELDKDGFTAYGGNYNFYREQKMIEQEALQEDLRSTEKALRKARATQRETMERQQKLDARGKKKQEKAGLPTISMNTFRNNAEKSTGRIKAAHAGKVEALAKQLEQARAAAPDTAIMRLDLDPSSLHRGKVLVTAAGINYRYHDRWLWEQGISFEIISGERIAFTGPNGSGKSSLLKLMAGQLEPGSGTIMKANVDTVYIDQYYSLVNNGLSVYQQAQRFNTGLLQEHDIKLRLNRFLFTRDHWDQPCHTLSGGERMRLTLCCLMIGGQAPGMIILDEPTNNLDMQNLEILTAVLRDYEGTLLVVSHDPYFLEQVGIGRMVKVG